MYSSAPSSPSALGVLLRSSVFKELVAKNSSARENETVDSKFHPRISIDAEDDFGGLFFSEEIPFSFPSNGIELPERELQFPF